MRFCLLILVCALFVVDFTDDGSCFNLAQKDKALESTGPSHLVASSHQSTKEFCHHASVDPACVANSSFQRSAFYIKDQKGSRNHGPTTKKFWLVMPLVSSDEWKTCSLLSPLWRQVVRGWRWGRLRLGPTSLCTMAPESQEKTGLWCTPAETTDSQAEQGQRTRRQHAKSETQTESSERQEAHNCYRPCRCSGPKTAGASRDKQWIELMDCSFTDATSSQSSSSCLTRCSQSSIGLCSSAAASCDEAVAPVFEEGSGETVAREPGFDQELDHQRRKERRERAADSSKRHGKGTQGLAGSIHCKVQSTPEVADILVDERCAMADIHCRISAAGVRSAAGHPSSQGFSCTSKAEPGDLEGGISIATRLTTGIRSTRHHVGRRTAGRSGSAKTTRGLAEFDDLPPRSPQGCRRRDSSRKCLEEGQTQWRQRCVRAARWKCLAAFWGARYFATLECGYQGQNDPHHEAFQKKWTHSILSEGDFRTEWQARAAAVRLSFDCGTICENHSSWRPTANTLKPASNRVQFEDSFSLLCSDQEAGICSIFHGKHGEVQKFIRQFQIGKPLEDDPLSNPTAVLISQAASEETDDLHLMQRPGISEWKPLTANEPDAPVWYPLTDRGAPYAADTDSEQDPDGLHSGDSEDDFDGNDDPDEPDSPNDPIQPPPEDHDRQSALMYHLEDAPIHAMLFWTDFDRLMTEIALHYQIPREELFDSYELNSRPPDIPPGTAPLLIHLVNDFPHGANLVLVLVDLEIHGNECETHYQTFPEMHRRVIPVPARLTRDTVLRLAKVLDFCKVEHERCLVEINTIPWLAQNRWPIDVQHGEYIKITIPPPTDGQIGTQEMLCAKVHHRPQRRHFHLISTVKESWTPFTDRFFPVIMLAHGLRALKSETRLSSKLPMDNVSLYISIAHFCKIGSTHCLTMMR